MKWNLYLGLNDDEIINFYLNEGATLSTKRYDQGFNKMSRTTS